MRPIRAVVLLATCLAWSVPAADFNGDSRDDIAIFRPAAGLWAVRGVTRAYFGTSGDTSVAGDYNGDGIAEMGIFRAGAGLWAIRGVTRSYFGAGADIPVSGGGGQRTCDYVVKAGDAADLVRALESNDYASVYVPAGDYHVSGTIRVDNVRCIRGEDPGFVTIHFGTDSYLSIESHYCSVDRITVTGGGSSSQNRGNFYVADAAHVNISNCASLNSADDGFEYTINSYNVSFINCRAHTAAYAGFRSAFGALATARLTNCLADSCVDGFAFCRNLTGCISVGAYQYGFSECWNLAACYADGINRSPAGFYRCENLSACQAYDCLAGAGTAGFHTCSQVSGCRVDGNYHTYYGFAACWYLSSCYVSNVTSTTFAACHKVDSESCNN